MQRGDSVASSVRSSRDDIPSRPLSEVLGGPGIKLQVVAQLACCMAPLVEKPSWAAC